MLDTVGWELKLCIYSFLPSHHSSGVIYVTQFYPMSLPRTLRDLTFHTICKLTNVSVMDVGRRHDSSGSKTKYNYYSQQ